MNKKLKICLLTLLLNCTIFSVFAIERNDLPTILQNHPDRSLFTKLYKKSTKPIVLFNGKDLTNFYTYDINNGKNNDPNGDFKVENGLIHFTGKAIGYACTKRAFKNYYLRVQTRWGENKYGKKEAKRDSGILYHFSLNEKDTVWPKSVECQIKEGDFGDYWFLKGATGVSPNETHSNHVVHTADFEKTHGEWNTIEIICFDNKSEYYVNGHKVNEAHNLNVEEGKILLQTQLAEVYYKDIVLIPLK